MAKNVMRLTTTACKILPSVIKCQSVATNMKDAVRTILVKRKGLSVLINQVFVNVMSLVINVSMATGPNVMQLRINVLRRTGLMSAKGTKIFARVKTIGDASEMLNSVLAKPPKMPRSACSPC